MRTVKAEPLSVEQFFPFGFFAGMLNPKTEKMGRRPIEFYRDMLQQDLGGAAAVSFSVCRVEKRPPVIDVTEYHTSVGEGILPLDADILIHVGPATPADGSVPLDKMRVFRVPRGTLVVLRPGVWHHAPFVMKGRVANVLIVLPERTYANDCRVFPLAPADQIRFTMF